MNHQCAQCGTYHEHGETVSRQDHQIPASSTQPDPAWGVRVDRDTGRVRHIGHALAVFREDVFEVEHANCEAAWECLGCGRSVCKRCQPSPAEEELCAECWWIADPNPNGDAA